MKKTPIYSTLFSLIALLGTQAMSSNDEPLSPYSKAQQDSLAMHSNVKNEIKELEKYLFDLNKELKEQNELTEWSKNNIKNTFKRIEERHKKNIEYIEYTLNEELNQEIKDLKAAHTKKMQEIHEKNKMEVHLLHEESKALEATLDLLKKQKQAIESEFDRLKSGSFSKQNANLITENNFLRKTVEEKKLELIKKK